MRTVLFILFFFIVISCEDDFTNTGQTIMPVWLETRVAELEGEGNCNGCIAKEILVGNKKYYHVYCNDWSCSHCEVYVAGGTLVDWAEQDLSEFLQNQTRSIVLWKCQGEAE